MIIEKRKERPDLRKQRIYSDKINSLYEGFLVFEKAKGISRQGYKTVRTNIHKFLEYISENRINLNEIGYFQAMEYQRYLIESGKKDGKPFASGTIHNYLKSAIRFFDFLKSYDLVRGNPFKSIRKVRYAKPLPKNILKEKEMNQLLEHLKGFMKQKKLHHRIAFYKTQVAAELMYSTGLRCSEVADLTIDNIDFERSCITVRKGKGGNERIVFLNEHAREILKLYVEKARLLSIEAFNNRNMKRLFGITGETLNINLNRMLKQATEKTGLPHLSTHGFRHAMGSHLLRAGCDIRYIQQLLGHKHIGNTEVYTKVEKEDLKDMLDTYHPRKWRKKDNEKTG